MLNDLDLIYQDRLDLHQDNGISKVRSTMNTSFRKLEMPKTPTLDKKLSDSYSK